MINWLEPVPFGIDAFGRLHHLQTVGTHTAFFGVTGSGKTRAGVGFSHTGLLDPRVQFAVIDGKDDANDWRPMRDLCEIGYVQGSNSATVGAVLRLLEVIEDLNNSRNDGDNGASEPVVLVVDEWYRIRQAAARHDADALKKIDSLMGDFAATSRSRHMHGIFHFQRGTVQYMPGDLGSNIAQRVQGKVAKKAEFTYSLNFQPEIVPTKPGMFLVSSDEGDTAALVSTPHLTCADQEQVIDAARRIRHKARQHVVPAVNLVKEQPEDEDREATWQELVQVILEEAGRPLSSKEILDRLPEDRRPTPFENRFGRDYLTPDAESDWPTVTRATTDRRTRGWRLADGVLPVESGYPAPSARSNVTSTRLLEATS